MLTNISNEPSTLLLIPNNKPKNKATVFFRQHSHLYKNK
jgi:hypothetical protein